MFYYFVIAFSLLAIELVYFSMARRFQILDRPNQRSSHESLTIRGGGIIFGFSVLLWSATSGWQWPLFVTAVMALSIIGFLDDIRPRAFWFRMLIQLIAVVLIFMQVSIVSWPFWLLIPATIICVGTLNSFNFMDGVNGMTGLYSGLGLLTFAGINRWVVSFTDEKLLIISAMGVTIFLVFNLRKKAVCFAGDVGSLAISSILIFFLLQLIVRTNNFLWVLMFFVYGVDSIFTILYRIRRKENIFHAHRAHLYQYLANELKWPHLRVSVLYASGQLALNVFIIYSFIAMTGVQLVVVSILLALAYWAFYATISKRLISVRVK